VGLLYYEKVRRSSVLIDGGGGRIAQEIEGGEKEGGRETGGRPVFRRVRRGEKWLIKFVFG